MRLNMKGEIVKANNLIITCTKILKFWNVLLILDLLCLIFIFNRPDTLSFSPEAMWPRTDYCNSPQVTRANNPVKTKAQVFTLGDILFNSLFIKGGGANFFKA